MIGGLMRAFGGFASKLAPRISRGIGQAVTATRHIGTAARQARDIGAAVNSATGGRLERSPYYNKALEVAGQVERGAAVAGEIGGDIQNRLN
jgi:putative IMPACT (imprinted ancient) family translation regulator